MKFIAQWEGFKSHAYWDETDGSGPSDMGTRMVFIRAWHAPRQSPLEWLKTDANRVAKYINSLDMNINQAQFDALVCFGFNVGTGNLKKSTLLKYVMHSAPSANVMGEFYKWTRSGGKVLPGLVLRREGEAMLYGDGKYATKKEAQVHIEKRLGKHWRSAVGCK